MTVRRLISVLTLLGMLLVFVSACTSEPTERLPSLQGEDYPPRVEEGIEAVKPVQGGLVLEEDGKTYLIVSYGEVPGSGYEVVLDIEDPLANSCCTIDIFAQTVSSVQQAGNILVVKSQLKEPATIEETYSYPYVVQVFNGTYDEVQLMDLDGKPMPLSTDF